MRKPLYPYIPSKREPLYPHVTPDALGAAKLKGAYDFFKANERRMGGSWAGMRHRIYEHVVLNLTIEDASKIPIFKRELPPRNWNIPPEYMVAYFRITRGMTKADAIKKVKNVYIPRLQREGKE